MSRCSFYALALLIATSLPAAAQPLDGLPWHPDDEPLSLARIGAAGNAGLSGPDERDPFAPPPEEPERRPEKKPKAPRKPAVESLEAFAGTDLLVGRGVKQPTGAKRFALGLNIQFAPMNLVLGSQKDTFVDTTVNKACGDDAHCQELATENMDDAMNAVAAIPEDDWNQLTQAATDDAAFAGVMDGLVDDGVLSEEEATSVEQFTEELPSAQEREVILTATRALSKQEATSVLVEPNLEINFRAVAFNVRVPFSLVKHDGGNSWNLGNVTLDTTFGHVFGSTTAAFGISYGFSLYGPTGTREAGAMALADLWFGPKFMHGYATASPFLAMGFDVPLISLQWHGEVVSQHQVWEGEAGLPGHVLYAKYGAGLVLMPNWPLSLIGEINGLAPFIEAKAYDALFGIAGVQLKLLWLKGALAAQFPILAPEPEDLGEIGGVSLGQLASYSIISRASFVF